MRERNVDRIDPMDRAQRRRRRIAAAACACGSVSDHQQTRGTRSPTRRLPQDAMHRRLWIDPTRVDVTRPFRGCMLLRNSHDLIRGPTPRPTRVDALRSRAGRDTSSRSLRRHPFGHRGRRPGWRRQRAAKRPAAGGAHLGDRVRYAGQMRFARTACRSRSGSRPAHRESSCAACRRGAVGRAARRRCRRCACGPPEHAYT